MGGGQAKQTASPPNELQLPCHMKNQMISRCASYVPSPRRRNQGHGTAIRRNSAAQRITMLTAPTSKTSRTKAPAPHQYATPRGGHRSNPRPKPRRHHLMHAADMGHTSPQRRHQHKAPCIVPLPGAAAATYNTPQTKATLPCINLRYKAGWLYFFIETGPNGIRVLRHQSSSNSSSSSSPASTS